MTSIDDIKRDSVVENTSLHASRLLIDEQLEYLYRKIKKLVSGNYLTKEEADTYYAQLDKFKNVQITIGSGSLYDGAGNIINAINNIKKKLDTHTHKISDIDGLQDILDELSKHTECRMDENLGPTRVTVGGLPAGSTGVEGERVAEVLRRILYPYRGSTGEVTIVPTSVIKGLPYTVTVNFEVTKNDAICPEDTYMLNGVSRTSMTVNLKPADQAITFTGTWTEIDDAGNRTIKSASNTLTPVIPLFFIWVPELIDFDSYELPDMEADKKGVTWFARQSGDFAVKTTERCYFYVFTTNENMVIKRYFSEAYHSLGKKKFKIGLGDEKCEQEYYVYEADGQLEPVDDTFTIV